MNEVMATATRSRDTPDPPQLPRPRTCTPSHTGTSGPIRLCLLGGWKLTGAVAEHVPLTVRRLTAFLSLRGPSTRDDLAANLWPKADEAHAYGSLRSALWRVRAVHSDLVEADTHGARLGEQVHVDVAELHDDARCLERGELPARLRSEPLLHLDQDLVPGWYDDWLVLDRERVRQLRLHALEHLATALASEGLFTAALEAALAAVRVEPLRESAHRVTMRVHLMEGNRSEALRQYESYRNLLDVELGVAPSPRMADLLYREDVGTADGGGSREVASG